MQATIIATSYRNKFVVITNEEPEPIRGGIEMALFLILYLCPQNLWKYIL
jgi:hypothetical protein